MLTKKGIKISGTKNLLEIVNKKIGMILLNFVTVYIMSSFPKMGFVFTNMYLNVQSNIPKDIENN